MPRLVLPPTFLSFLGYIWKVSVMQLVKEKQEIAIFDLSVRLEGIELSRTSTGVTITRITKKGKSQQQIMKGNPQTVFDNWETIAKKILNNLNLNVLTEEKKKG